MFLKLGALFVSVPGGLLNLISPAQGRVFRRYTQTCGFRGLRTSAPMHCGQNSHTSNTYPVFIVSGAVLQQVLQLDGAVGHKVIISDGCIVENRQLQTPSLTDLSAELLVPGGAVGLGPGCSLAKPGLVKIQGQVGVQ